MTFSRSAAKIGLTTLLALAAPLSNALEYRVTELVQEGLPMDINNAGDVVGSISYIDGRVFGFRYINGILDVQQNTSGVDNSAFAINDAGQILSSSGLVTPGSPTVADPRVNYIASDLNQAGQYTGQLRDAAGNPTTPFLFSGGQITPLGQQIGGGIALNDRGAVTGYAQFGAIESGAQGYHAFIATNGSMQDLGTLPGTGPFSWGPSQPYSIGNGINNAGAVVGLSNDQAFIYRDGVMSALPMLPGTETSRAMGINEAGQVVGSSFGNNVANAFLITDGQTYTLDGLLAPEDAARWHIWYATKINDYGAIIGVGSKQDEFGGTYDYGVLLTPTAVPEPSALVLQMLGISAIGWAVRARNRRENEACW